MNISIIDPSSARTGAFIAATEMAACFASKHNVCLFSELADCSGSISRLNGVSQLYLSIGRGSSKPWHLLLFVLRGFFASIYLRILFVRKPCDILILNDFYLFHGIFLKALGFRGKVVTWVRISVSRFGFWGRCLLLLNKFISTELVFVSKHLSRETSLPGEVIYDTVRGSEIKYHDCKTEGQIVFIYPGNYVRGKGQDIAILALAMISRRDIKLTLRFHGGTLGLRKNDGYKEELIDLASQLCVDDYVEFHDSYNHLSEIIGDAYAVLNFSESESFSLTILEATAFGLPVIATASGGPQEIIISNRTGILIQCGDVEQASNAMFTLASDRELARCIGMAAHKRFLDAFSHERYCKTLSDLLARNGSIKN